MAVYLDKRTDDPANDGGSGDMRLSDIFPEITGEAKDFILSLVPKNDTQSFYVNNNSEKFFISITDINIYDIYNSHNDDKKIKNIFIRELIDNTDKKITHKQWINDYTHKDFTFLFYNNENLYITGLSNHNEILLNINPEFILKINKINHELKKEKSKLLEICKSWTREIKKMNIEPSKNNNKSLLRCIDKILKDKTDLDQTNLSTSRVLLNVPFAERRTARALGAKWDVGRKTWFVPSGVDLAPLGRWLPRGADPLAAGSDPGPQGTPGHGGRGLLSVPFAERGQAMALGARWDRAAKHWLAPDGADRRAFGKWAPEWRLAGENGPGPAQDFGLALRSGGLAVDVPEMDGQEHRAPLSGGEPGNLDGAYLARLGEFPMGWHGNLRTGDRRDWAHTGQRLSRRQVEGLRTEAELNVEARKQGHAALHALNVQKAERRIRLNSRNEAAALESHPFLVKKGITAPVGVLFEDKGGQVNLLVPAHVPRPFGYEPEFQTYQAISPGGQSSLALGCPGNGAVFMVDGDRHDRKLDHEYATWIEKGRDPARRPVILVAEDLPSAKTLHDASGRPVACAFNGDNLRPASENLRKAYPAAILVVCANSGQGGKDGHGPDAGRKAAAGIGAYALALKFSDEEAAKNMTNYNDMAKIHGMNKFKVYFSKLIHRLRVEKTCYKNKYFENINMNLKIYSPIFFKIKIYL